MKILRRDLPPLLIVVAYALIELGWARLHPPAPPVTPGFLAGGWLLLVVGGWIGVRLLRRLEPVPFLTVLLTAAALGTKLWLVAGFRGFGSAWLVVGLPVILVYLLVNKGGVVSPNPSAWTTLLLVTLIMSTDVLKVLWLWVRRSGPGYGVILSLLMIVGLLFFMGIWSGLEGWLSRWWTGASLLLGAAVIGSIAVGGSGGTSGFLEAGAVPFEGDFSGRVPEPRRTAEDGSDPLPNLILISVDTLRWDRVPPRADGFRVPNLKRLRKDSLTFRRAYSSSSWTLPAHASLFTGLLPVEHGGLGWLNRIYSDRVLYAQMLKKLGYRTAAFTDGGPVSARLGFGRGFDRYWEQPTPFPARRHRVFTPGLVELVYPLQRGWKGGSALEIRHRFSPPEPSRRQQLHYARRNLGAARQWIRRTDGDAPYFLFLHTFQVHDYADLYPDTFRALWRDHPDFRGSLRRIARVTDNRDVLERIGTDPTSANHPAGDPDRGLSDTRWRRILDRAPEGLAGASRRRYHRRFDALAPRSEAFLKRELARFDTAWVRYIRRQIAHLSGEEWKRFNGGDSAAMRRTLRLRIRAVPPDQIEVLRRAYDRGIEAVDAALGRFLDWLRDRGEYEEALIVFTSDHGEGFGREAPVIFGHDHGHLHEVLTRVPLWIKWPDDRGGGRRVGRPVQLRDVFPIVLRRLGIRPLRPNRPEFSPSAASGWVRSGPVSVPDREIVRTSIARVPANDVLPPAQRRVRLSVQGRRVKFTQHRPGRDTAFVRVTPDSLREAVPVGVTRSVRRSLIDEMKRYRRLQTGYPSPFLRAEADTMHPRLRRKLRGLGYIGGP